MLMAPPLNREGDGGQVLNQDLRRRKVWMTRRDEAEHQGEQLKPYALRYRYAKGMHAANAPIANFCEAMVHTIEAHLKSYARFKPNATAEAKASAARAAPDEAVQGLGTNTAGANRLMIYLCFRLDQSLGIHADIAIICRKKQKTHTSKPCVESS